MLEEGRAPQHEAGQERTLVEGDGEIEMALHIAEATLEWQITRANYLEGE